MYKLEIYPDEALVVCVCSGEIEVKELQKASLELANHTDYARHYDGVIDLKSAKAALTPRQLQAFCQALVDRNGCRGSWCLISNSPMETAMAMIFAHALRERHPVGVFSTIKAASEYLNKDLSHHLSEYVRERRMASPMLL